MTYRPNPIDTTHIVLPPGLDELQETLAEHNHDIWAMQRIAEGWTLGPERNDRQKTHPGLVSYQELPDSEKEYDRKTSAEAIKAILAKGYQIVPPDGVPIGEQQVPDDFAARIEAVGSHPTELLSLWQKRSSTDSEWTHCAEAYRLIARKFLSCGAPLVALEVITEGLQHWKNNIDLRQLQGLALARTGAAQRANHILQAVADELDASTRAIDPVELEETLGLLARTHKDLAFTAASEEDQQFHLTKSLELYHDAYLRTGRRFWTGINVATLATLSGQEELAREIAEEVRNGCWEKWNEIEKDDPERYWIAATLGEAALNLQDDKAAETHYREAAQLGQWRHGDMNATRRQARWLLRHLDRDEGLVENWLPVPGVAVFSGHMIDQPNRPDERFPARFAPAVKNTITRWLKENNIRIGFSSAACGADLLFQEALSELGGECHVIMPYLEEQFLEDSVDITDDPQWMTRFQDVLKRATQTVYTSNQKMKAGSVSYDYANLVLHGLATVRAGELETAPMGLVVWNGERGDGPGGTASCVARWRGMKMPISRVDLSTLPNDVPKELPLIKDPDNSIAPNGQHEGDSETEVMAMLFADAVGFSQLTEEQVPRFVQYFLGDIARIVEKYAAGNVVKNTWGDGLYLVFKTVRDAGICALELREMVQKTRWEEKHLPDSLALRIALHAGPVFGGIDPVTGHMNYTGTHVSRAARLEPKTPPGEVYASEAFAAMVAVGRIDKHKEFACKYVKQLEWDKRYGTFPTYVVRQGPGLSFT